MDSKTMDGTPQKPGQSPRTGGPGSLDIKSPRKQRRQRTGAYKGRQTAVREPTRRQVRSPSVDSGYSSSPASTPLDSFDLIAATSPVSQLTPTLPIDPTTCTLDEENAVHCSDTVELLSVMDADGKPTQLLFKTLPALMENDGMERRKAWAWRAIENEAFVFDKVPEDPKLVKCYGLQTINGRKGLLLERIQGATLEQRFKELRHLYQAQQLTQDEFMCANRYLARQAALCLKHLQDAGFIHGDFKPDNLIYDLHQGQLRLIDLGSSSNFDEVAHPGHELYVDPAAVSFKVLDRLGFQAEPPALHLWIDEELKEELHPGAISDPKMDVYGLGQMMFVQGFTKGEEPEMFTMGADIGSFRTRNKLLIHNLFMRMPERYEKFPVLPVFSHDFPKSELASALEKTNTAVAYKGGYYSFINDTLSPLRANRATVEEVLDSSFLKLNKRERAKAERVLKNSSQKYLALKNKAAEKWLEANETALLEERANARKQ